MANKVNSFLLILQELYVMRLNILLATFFTLLPPIGYASEFCKDSESVSHAESQSNSIQADTVAPLSGDETKKKGIIARIIDYFDESNKPKKNKKFDFSIIGGPHYSSDTKFGIGVVAAGIYRSDTTHSDSVYLTPESNVAIYADATTSMFFKLGIRGTHIFKNDKARLKYDCKLRFGQKLILGYRLRKQYQRRQ